MVRVSNPKDHPGLVGVVLSGDFVCASADGAKHGGRPASGMVPQTPPDLLRCFSADTQGFVGKCDFSRVACAERHGKSPKGISGTSNRRGLLGSVNG